MHCWLSSYFNPEAREPRFISLYKQSKEIEVGKLKIKNSILFNFIHKKLFLKYYFQKSIIIKICGEFGDQLFQYAFAKALSLRFNKFFSLDISWYKENNTQISFALNKLNIQYEIASVQDVSNIVTCDGANFFEYRKNRIKNKFAPYFKKNVIKENHDTCFDKNLLRSNSYSYFEGYFASEHYFKDYAEIIKKDFEFKDQPSLINSEKIKQMQQCNSVCISIHRGDFINNTLQNVCNMNYFNDSILHISKMVDNPYFYIFSDDNEWVKNNFKTEFPHEFVTHNFNDFIEDFRLMQNCKHHIIPNNTLSWWAAWLAEKIDSIIIVPEKWLNSDTIDYSKVVPERWIKIYN